MKSWIEGLSRLEDAEGDMDEFAHHGADDDHGGLAGGGEAIRDQRDFERHCDYLHDNPVKHGHVTRVADWPYSSFHRFVENGVYPLDWAGNPELRDTAGFGE